MSNKLSLRNGGIIVLCLLLAITAGVLYMLSLKHSGKVYQRGVDVVSNIQRLDSSWSMEAVKVRSNPQADFDSLAAFIPKMNLLKDQLAGIILSDVAIPDRLVNSTNAFISQLDAKEVQVERFKSGYAIIRNSERYLPLAASLVIQAAQNNSRYDVVNEVTVLVDEVNAYLVSPNDTEKSRLGLSLNSLLDKSGAFSPNLTKAIASFISHSNVLLETSIPTDALFVDATSSNVADDAERLVVGFKAIGDNTRKLAKNYEYGALAALCALILVSLFHGMRKNVEAAPSKLTIQGDDEAMPNLPGSNRGEDISYQIFAGMIGDNMVRALGDVKSNTEMLKSYSEKMGESFSDIQHSIDSIERGDYSGEKGLVTLKSKLNTSLSTVDRGELSGLIDTVEKSYRTALHLAKQLTDFSGKENDKDHEWVNINDAVRETVLPADYDNKAAVDIRLGDIPHIYGSAMEIKYMIKNIIDNAVAAVESVGKDSASIKVQTQLLENQIGITVTDNGVGFEPEKRKYVTQLFKPNDKKHSKLDLGLPSSHYLARRYGGKLMLNSVLGKGTAIRILLPEARGAA